MPPAPLLLSTTTVCPRPADTACASKRAKLSLGPPGGKGSTQVTFFSGQSRACARRGTSAAAAKPVSTARRLVLIRLLELDVGGLGDSVPADDLLLDEATEIG